MDDVDPRWEALLREQQFEMAELFDQFRAANPNLPIDIEGVDWWPGTKDDEFDAFCAPLAAEHAAAREALILIVESES